MSDYAYHHEKAEHLLKEASQMQGSPADRCVFAAQVHATLALAEAQADICAAAEEIRKAVEEKVARS